jgi:hypothetical protein
MRDCPSSRLFAACRDFISVTIDVPFRWGERWACLRIGTLAVTDKTCLSRYTPVARGVARGDRLAQAIHSRFDDDELRCAFIIPSRGEHVHALRSRERGCFLVVQTLWVEKNQSITDAGSLNTFGRNEIEVDAYFIGTSSHCVFSNTIQNFLFRTKNSPPMGYQDR